MKHPRLTFPCRAAAALALLGAALTAHASTVHDLRQWLEGLSGVYAAQQASNPWTFHNNDHTGTLFTTNGSSYRGATSPQSIGSLVDPGELQCTPGFCGGAVTSETRATFAGTFVHTGSAGATAAVFHVTDDIVLEQILLTSEMVQNAHNGDGMDVQVRVVAGNVTHDLGQFTVTYGNTRTAANQTIYTPGLTLAAGDLVEVRYEKRGSYLYDHGNVDIRITTGPVDASGPGAALPEPSSAGLAVLALAAIWRGRRGARDAFRSGRRAPAAARPARSSSRA